LVSLKAKAKILKTYYKCKKILGTLILGLLCCSVSFASETKPLNKSGFIFNDGKRVKYIKNYKITNPDNTILIIYNHGLVAINQKWCNWPSNVRQISKLSGQKINGKEIKVFMNCEHTRVGGKLCKKEEFKSLEEFVGDKALCKNVVYFNRKQATVNLLKKFIRDGVKPKHIFTAGGSWGGWNALRIAAFNSELINSSVAINPACCDIKINQKKGNVRAKEFEWFTYQLKSAKEINALVLSGYADRFETPESIGFLKNINGIEFVELPGFDKEKREIKIEGTVCRWDFHDQNNKKIMDGHLIFNSSCFSPYVDVIKNYIESRI